MTELTHAALAAMFDHTNLKPFADEAAFAKLCTEADENGFAMVAVNSAQVRRCRRLLGSSPVHVGAAIGFPLGQTTTSCKVHETQTAITEGADEIDYVVNLSELKCGNWAYVEDEMQRIVDVCRKGQVLVKVIFEICYLTDEEIIRLAEIARHIRPDYIKTSTGFGTGGATVHAVSLMKQTVGDTVKVKAAGGIRSWEACRAMIEGGAERIGTSASLQILKEFDESRC